MASVNTMFHLMGALRRAAGRVFLAFFLTLIIVAALAEGLHYILTNPHYNGTLTHIVAALLAVGWAIAVSLIVLIGEVIRGLVTGVKDTVKDVEKEVGDAGQLVQGAIRSVEGKGQQKR
jgi:hypothetical protein